MVLLVLTFNGCAIIGHLNELSTMGEFARDKDNQNKIVNLNNSHYDALMAAINAKEMVHFTNQAEIRNTFGEPIVIKTITVDGKIQEQWLYRYAVIKQAKDKVYLYFDDQGKFLNYKQEKIEW